MYGFFLPCALLVGCAFRTGASRKEKCCSQKLFARAFELKFIRNTGNSLLTFEVCSLSFSVNSEFYSRSMLA